MRDVGLRISEARKRRGLSQKILAERIGRSVASISGYEAETQLPPLDVLNDIANALNISMDYLAGNDDNCFISGRSLTPDQADLLELLMVEFTTPSNSGSELSEQQMKILMKLGHIFMSR